MTTWLATGAVSTKDLDVSLKTNHSLSPKKENKMEHKFYGWPSIESFHAVRKSVGKYPALVPGNDLVVSYRGKVKLHGTNAGIQCHENGEVVAQSRSNLLIGKDNAGFATWVIQNNDYWSDLGKTTGGVIVFGEWCGSGIQSGVAISQIQMKVFAVFAIQSMKNEEQLIVDPEEISKILGPTTDKTKVLPWATEAFTVDFNETAENLQPIVDKINAAVEEIERCDPWVEQNYNVKGVGEGLVYFPNPSDGSRQTFSNLAFKAKGEEHRVVKSNKAVQLEPTNVASTDAFAELVLTEARLQQGAKEISPTFEKQNIGKFIGWVSQDVFKECKAEIAASGIDWHLLAKGLVNKARTWYLGKC